DFDCDGTAIAADGCGHSQCLYFSEAAAAQEQLAPATMYPGMAGGGRKTCGMGGNIEGGIRFLQTELKREKRERLWREARDRAKEMRSANLLDTITMAEEQLSQRLESLRAMKAALQPLYTNLDKEQKKIADQIMKGGQVF